MKVKRKRAQRLHREEEIRVDMSEISLMERRNRESKNKHHTVNRQ